MTQPQVAVDFDEISRVYDTTRDPLDAATIDGMVGALQTAGVASLLEVGVGTGRVARPLTDRGLNLTGIDLSRGMLERAHGKGLRRLVRGSGYHLPFRPKVFDATLFVHVLHVLDDPRAAIREGIRVSRHGAYALVHPRGGESEPHAERGQDEAQRILREVLVEQGYVPPSHRSNPWMKERELIVAIPPDSLDVVSETEVTESLQSRFDRLARRGHRMLLKIPPETLERAIKAARERAGKRTVTYHRVEALAHWATSP